MLQKKKGITGDAGEKGETFWGGNDRTLSGSSAAHGLRHRASYRPSCPAKLLAPPPADLQVNP
jgi:hypothetical protein